MLCKHCLISKPKSEFYEKSKSQCKKCVSKHVMEYQKANKDKLRKWQLKYAPKRPFVGKETRSKYNRTSYEKNGHSSDPLKRLTHQLVNRAVRVGKLYKPKNCPSCSSTDKRIEGHHFDYYKPLDIIWLCSTCHHKVHMQAA